MSEVFAGFVAGYALALASTPLAAIWLLRLRATSPLLERLLPAGSSAMGVGVILHGALFLFWTAVGILLGLLLYGMRDVGSLPGLPNPPFSLLVVSLVLMLVAPLVVVLPTLRQPVLVGATAVLLLFGGLMPYMAGWSNFEPAPKPPVERIADPIFGA